MYIYTWRLTGHAARQSNAFLKKQSHYTSINLSSFDRRSTTKKHCQKRSPSTPPSPIIAFRLFFDLNVPLTLLATKSFESTTPSPSELRPENRGTPLPLLIILPATIPLVIFFLTQRHPAPVKQQTKGESRTHRRHCQSKRSSLQTGPEPHSVKPGAPSQDAGGCDSDATPQNCLAEVVWMPAS